MSPLPEASTVTPKVKTLLVALRRRLEELYGDRLVKMILYGSQARGDAREYSDTDVLVVLRDPVQPSEEVGRTGSIVSELSLENDEVIQCFFMGHRHFMTGESPLLRNIRREGVEA